MNGKTFITFERARDLLMSEAGLRKREAEAYLARNLPEPEWSMMAALRITRRRWRQTVVLDFCANLKNNASPLGKGASEVAASQP